MMSDVLNGQFVVDLLGSSHTVHRSLHCVRTLFCAAVPLVGAIFEY